MDIIRRCGGAVLNKAYVAVLINPSQAADVLRRDPQGAAGALHADLSNVEVLADSGLLADVTQRLGADCVVKGLRSEATTPRSAPPPPRCRPCLG